MKIEEILAMDRGKIKEILERDGFILHPGETWDDKVDAFLEYAKNYNPDAILGEAITGWD